MLSNTFAVLAGLAAALQATALPRGGHHDWSGAKTKTVVAPVDQAVTQPITDPTPDPVIPAPAPVVTQSAGGGGAGAGGAESHQLVNNCGSGSPVFIYRDNSSPMGSTTINGPLYGGVAWMDNYADCGMSGVNCGTVEFSLINPDADAANTQNSINYSLQSMGNHLFQYPMSFSYTGGCSGGAPGTCTSDANCPGAFWGTDAENGTPVNCVGSNAGITITFC